MRYRQPRTAYAAAGRAGRQEPDRFSLVTRSGSWTVDDSWFRTGRSASWQFVPARKPLLPVKAAKEHRMSFWRFRFLPLLILSAVGVTALDAQPLSTMTLTVDATQ